MTRDRQPGAGPVATGRRAALEAVRAGRAFRVLVAAGSRATPSMRDLLEASARAGVRVEEVERAALDRMAEDHHGVAVELRPAPALGERDLSTFPFGDEDVVVVLDGITDPHNLGAAARSAEAAGVAMLVSRIRRAAPVTPAAVRASAGALLHLPHTRVANLARALDRLRDRGFTVVGLDEQAPADVYAEPCADGRVALVLGSEGEGLSRLVRERCDLLVRLPMRGSVSSLNVSASLAAALFAYVLPSRRG
ncbi:MAG: 23S rRNA (guanosine(2251)-2'-O)-methyltransferase RlmB [Candidatus Velamenicoccus archaeovorus]